MKPLKHLLLMAVAALALTFIEGMIIDSMIYDPALALGMALVSFLPSAITMLVGFILMKMNRPKWSTVITIAWILLILSNFFALYGRI